jgi:hypothetical protein
MSRKTPFTFLIRPEEREILKHLAQTNDRSEGATLRWLIRESAIDVIPRGLLPKQSQTAQPSVMHPTNNTA